MKFNGYIKVDKCPLEEIGYNTPCKEYVKSKGLECALYCDENIVNVSNDIKKKMAHILCLTDENNRANFIAFSLLRIGKGDGLIYPIEYYKNNKK